MLFTMSLKLERAPKVKPEVPLKLTLLDLNPRNLDLKENFQSGGNPLKPEGPLEFTILSFQINFRRLITI